MKEIEQLKEPFERLLDQQLAMLDDASGEIEDTRGIIDRWPERKKRINDGVIESMKKWVENLKQMSRPLRNWKRFKREKKRLARSKYSLWFQGNGLTAKSKIALVRTVNIIRITALLLLYIGVIVLVSYLIAKLISSIGVIKDPFGE
jgi:hypothetical protein